MSGIPLSMPFRPPYPPSSVWEQRFAPWRMSSEGSHEACLFIRWMIPSLKYYLQNFQAMFTHSAILLPWRWARWENISKMSFPACQWWLFPSRTVLWKPCLTMSYSSSLCISLSKALLNNKPLSLSCLPVLYLPIVNCVGEELGQLPLLWKWGWGELRRKRAMQDTRQVGPMTFPLSLCVSTELSCFFFVMGSSVASWPFGWIGQTPTEH